MIIFCVYSSLGANAHLQIFMHGSLVKKSLCYLQVLTSFKRCLTEKCKRLVEIARSYDLLVISDDVYNVLNYETDETDPEKFLPSPRRLFAYDEKSDDDFKGDINKSCITWF